MLVGQTKDELGGSRWLRAVDGQGGQIPQVDLPYAKQCHRTVASLLQKGLALSCHDLSEGGLAAAAAEMALAGGFGVTLDLAQVLAPKPLVDPTLLFSESATRYLLEVDGAELPAVKSLFDEQQIPWAVVGKTTAEPSYQVNSQNTENSFQLSLQQLTEAFRTGLQLDALQD